MNVWIRANNADFDSLNVDTVAKESCGFIQ